MSSARGWWAWLVAAVPLAGFACENPPLVQIPRGDLGAREQAEVQDAFGRYYQALEAYTACIKAELEAAGGDDAPPLVKALLVQRHNTAVAEADAMLKLYDATVGGAAQPARAVETTGDDGSRRRDRH
ncbi:MAG TPA: hypothetical protein VF322_07420 [Gammaproteobacteria bacterium]